MAIHSYIELETMVYISVIESTMPMVCIDESTMPKTGRLRVFFHIEKKKHQ